MFKTNTKRARSARRPEARAQRVVVRLARSALAALLAFSAGCAAVLACPREALAAVPINLVSDDDFAPNGYSWYFDFESVSSESGFQRIADLTPYYSLVNHSDPSAGFFDCVKEGDSGYAAFIDGSTSRTLPNGSPRFSLRFSGGTYNDRPIDAVLSIVDWVYTEPSVGWDYYWEITDPLSSFENFSTGIFYNEGYTNDSRYQSLNEQPSLTNINLYLVGLSSVTIELDFYEAGTDTPVSVRGHATAIDIDCNQSLVFEQGITRADVARSSAEISPDGMPFLTIEASKDRVTSGTYAVSANNSDGYYERTLVATYFSTSASTPYSVTFQSPWIGSHLSNAGGAGTAMSFFALTPEYVANPAIDDLVSVKKRVSAADPVGIGERFTYYVDVTVPIEGLTCRFGYRYQSLELVDELDSNLRFVEGSGRFLAEGTTAASALAGANAVSYDEETNTLSMNVDSLYLSTMDMNGETYTFAFDVYADSYPEADEEGRFVVPNTARVVVNGQNLTTNRVDVELVVENLPTDSSVTVVKRIRADEVYRSHGDPAFLFTLEGTDVSGSPHAYRALAEFPEGIEADEDGYLSTTVVFENVPVGSYSLSEHASVRYKLASIESNGTVSEDTVSFDLAVLGNGTATFTNEKTTSYGGSDSTSVINSFETV